MKSILVCNWKMNPATYREAKLLFDATKKSAVKAKNIQLIVAPPTIFLYPLSEKYRGAIAFAMQNGYAEASGAHTGETAYAQGKQARATYTLVGHAERRALGETNENTRTKVAGAIKAGLMPILCIGEEVRSVAGEHFSYIKEQLRIGLGGVQPLSLKKIMIHTNRFGR